MKNSQILFPRTKIKSNASPKIRALCGSSAPANSQSVIDYQNARLKHLKDDKDTSLFIQNGKVFTGGAN